MLRLLGMLLLVAHWSACVYFILNLAEDPQFATEIQAADPGVWAAAPPQLVALPGIALCNTPASCHENAF